jgi:hypothetical protein
VRGGEREKESGRERKRVGEGEKESERGRERGRERKRGRDKAELRVNHTNLLDNNSALDVIDMTSCSIFFHFD